MGNRPNHAAIADAEAAYHVATGASLSPQPFLIVGGGLAGGLIALALARAGRGHQVVLVEQDRQLGGNHTWSFHHTDLDDVGRALVADLVSQSWPRQSVRFPGHERVIESGYSTITSQQFARVLAVQLREAGVRLLLGRTVVAVGSSVVRLADDKVLHGQLVIDARGPVRESDGWAGGFQKFVGLELELTSDGPWTDPLLMDATVPQVGGYRFTYVLPFSPRHVLLEDTIYSRDPVLDVEGCARGIHHYAARHGASVGRVIRREIGVLPLPTGGLSSAAGAGAVCVGYRGGFFHDVTGYSLPLAVRVALAVAQARTPEDARRAIDGLSSGLRSQHRFGRLLNRLMFDAMPAARRWTAFDRFYHLPDATIARFYASQSTWGDRARVLVGRPPSGVSWAHLLSGGRRGSRDDESPREDP